MWLTQMLGSVQVVDRKGQREGRMSEVHSFKTGKNMTWNDSSVNAKSTI